MLSPKAGRRADVRYIRRFQHTAAALKRKDVLKEQLHVPTRLSSQIDKESTAVFKD